MNTLQEQFMFITFSIFFYMYLGGKKGVVQGRVIIFSKTSLHLFAIRTETTRP